MTEVIVDSVTQRGAVVLRLSGTLDSSTSDRVTQELQSAATRPRAALVVLDLRDLDLLTGDGIRVLRLYAQSLARANASCAVLATPGSTVAQAIDTADPGHILPWFPDLDQALATSAGMTTALETVAADDDETSRLTAQFETLTRSLLRETTVGETLAHIVHATAHVVPHADLVSITLRTADGTFYTPVETGPAARELDEVQYRTRRGPCLDAARSDGPAYASSDDLPNEDRWPQFAAAATDFGYGAVIATALLPANGPAQLSGALNVYSHQTRGLTSADRHSALLLATHASLALAHAHTAELAALQQLHLRRAIDTRDVIGQAKGILMNRQGITADEAFDLLRRTSQDLNIKLVDLATTLANHHADLDPLNPNA